MIDVDTIAQALAPAVSELGLDLYDVDVSGTGRARILRVMIDREGGVDLEAIADATRAVSPLLDAPPLDAVIAGPYALEVSSPGLERPLRTPAHFAGAVGETISVKVHLADDQGARHGSRRVRGVVTAADDTSFELLLDDGASERIQYADLTQARTVFEWETEPKRGSSKGTPSAAKQSKGTKSENVSSQKEPVRR